MRWLILVLCISCSAGAEEKKPDPGAERQAEAWWRKEVNCNYTLHACKWAYATGELDNKQYRLCVFQLKEILCLGVKWME